MRVHGQVQTNDLYAMLLGIAGVARPAPAGARPLPLDNDQRPREYAVAEWGPPSRFLRIMYSRFPETPRRFDRSLVAVRGPRYKYIWGSDGRSELFDIVRDPGETRDLSAELEDVSRELRSRVFAFRKLREDHSAVSQ
jgi:hypothetical protein